MNELQALLIALGIVIPSFFLTVICGFFLTVVFYVVVGIIIEWSVFPWKRPWR